jgi:adenylosuccinate lyase
VILPDACIIAHFMLAEITDLIKNLLVYPDNMQRNLNCYGGVVFSQKVLLALVDKGLSREQSYAIVQSSAHQAWNKLDGDFRGLIQSNAQVQSLLSAAEIDACFDCENHIKNLDLIFQRLGI